MTNPQITGPVEDRIRTFIAQNLLYSAEGFAYSNDTSFLQEGIIDSLNVMQLVEFVEREFAISVLQHEVTPDNFDSVGKMATFVRGKLPAQPSTGG